MKLLLICLLMCSAGFADGVGKIAGRVVDENGDALVNASILVLETKQGNVTDLEGQFVIPGVTPGKYSVSVSSLGYGTQEFKDIYVGSDSTTTLNSTLLLKILPLASVEIVTRLRAMGTIAGRVVDENDIGIPSAEVLVYTSSGLVHIDVERPRRVFTDGSGRYSCFAYIGACAIEINCLGYIKQKIRDIEIRTGDTTTVNVKLVKELQQSEAQIKGVVTGKIAGTVVDENGDGIIGANVQILETKQGVQVLNPDGSYVILGVEPGTYSLQFSSTDLRQQRFTGVEVVSNRITTVNAVLTTGFKMGLEGAVCGYKKHKSQLGEALKIHMGPPFFIERKPQVELPSQFRVEPRYRHYLTQPSGRDVN